jgi:hypothetical protein
VTIDPLVLVTAGIAAAGGFVWLGVLSQRVLSTERETGQLRHSLHELRNFLTPIIGEIKEDIARILAIDENRR